MHRTAPRGSAAPHEGQPDAPACVGAEGAGLDEVGGGGDEIVDGREADVAARFGTEGSPGTTIEPWQLGQLICIPS